MIIFKISFFQVCILELEEFGVTHPHPEGHHLLPEREHQPRPGPGEVRVLAVPGPEHPRQSLKQELLPTGLQGSPHPPAQGAWLSLSVHQYLDLVCQKLLPLEVLPHPQGVEDELPAQYPGLLLVHHLESRTLLCDGHGHDVDAWRCALLNRSL